MGRFSLLQWDSSAASHDNLQPVHVLRHAHATLALQAGVHPRVVSERLGHATVSTVLGT
jgi:site-specific recombinase XerD